jgi:predicted porin
LEFLMKKSLLALAVLGAFAGAASAQSSVTIYGIVDASVSRIDNGVDSVNGLDSGNNAASRIGFKGVEDLGNGLKASFVLENGFDVDSGASGNEGSSFSRLAYVGLGGDFGTVRLGRQNSQIAEVVSIIDPFQKSGMVNGVDFYNGGGVSERVSNQISYISNNYGGFSGAIGYRFGEQPGDNSANRGWGLQLGYANGPLAVQFGYDNQQYSGAINGDGEFEAGPATGGVDGKIKDALLGATYDFGAFKLHGAYGQRKIDASAGAFFNGTAEDQKIRSYIVGATVPFGASKVRAEYIRNNNRDLDDADSNVYALSYSYALSKRTQLYATYARVSNDDGSSLGIGGPGSNIAAAGENSTGFAVGVQHNF